jgi:uncharacterized protein (DUF697 family)
LRVRRSACFYLLFQMSPNVLLSLYEKLEGLISKLPGPLQHAVFNELRPIKQIFIAQRLPRIALVGEPGTDVSAIFSALLGNELRMVEPTSSTGWVTYEQRGKGGFRILDGRRLNENSLTWGALAGAISEECPDLFLFVLNGGKQNTSGSGSSNDLGLECEQAGRILELVETHHQSKGGMIGVIDLPASTPSDAIEAKRLDLQAWLTSQARLSRHFVKSVAICSFVRFRPDGSIDAGRDERKSIEFLAEAIARDLPEESQVELARLLHIKALQTEIAQRLTRSITTICAAIGAQPIPLADFPILTALQFAMVSGIMHISGRELGLKAATEFCGALGMNLGVGVVLREGARAAVKFLPGWGNAISGGVAAAGTYAIGRAAIAYFIEGISLPETRKLFGRKGLPKRK